MFVGNSNCSHNSGIAWRLHTSKIALLIQCEINTKVSRLLELWGVVDTRHLRASCLAQPCVCVLTPTMPLCEKATHCQKSYDMEKLHGSMVNQLNETSRWKYYGQLAYHQYKAHFVSWYCTYYLLNSVHWTHSAIHIHLIHNHNHTAIHFIYLLYFHYCCALVHQFFAPLYRCSLTYDGVTFRWTHHKWKIL